MSQYLLSFAKESLAEKSDAYLALLWCMYKGRKDKGRYSDHIKDHITSVNNELLATNYQQIAARFKRILDARPELDWVAPSGLRPLATLQVKNFRGFGAFGANDKGTQLQFSKIKNIFYAPNGGGKSSLCEALEYATTGHIKEAGRRKTKVKQYIARGSDKADLRLIGTDRNTVPASLTWSSCFIDRNRLQEFSLLGSKDTGSAESDVIATLFGLEEFQEVISRFVKPESFNLSTLRRPNQSEAVLTLQAVRAELYEQRHKHRDSIFALNDDVCTRLGLRVDQQFAVRARSARLTKLANLKIRNAERLRIAEVPFGIPMHRVVRAARIAQGLLERKSKIDAAFQKNVMAVNYRAVYEALQAIENTEASQQCPACSTPLDRVVENPFNKARRELETLGVITQLAKSQRRVEGRIVQVALAISNTIAAVDSNARLGLLCGINLDALRASLTEFNNITDRGGAATQVLTKLTELLAAGEEAIETYLNSCEGRRAEIARADAQVKRLGEEASQLSQAAEELKELFDEKRTLLAALKEIGRQLGDLTRQRASLQSGNTDNARFNTLIDQLQLEYGNLYRDLLRYRFTLEKARIAGIEGKAAQYYCVFRRT